MCEWRNQGMGGWKDQKEDGGCGPQSFRHSQCSVKQQPPHADSHARSPHRWKPHHPGSTGGPRRRRVWALRPAGRDAGVRRGPRSSGGPLGFGLQQGAGGGGEHVGAEGWLHRTVARLLAHQASQPRAFPDHTRHPTAPHVCPTRVYPLRSPRTLALYAQ